MNGRGRPAAMPVGGHQRDLPLAAGDLVVRHLAEHGGRTAFYDFGSLPVSAELRREFAEAFARRVGPEGTWRSIASSREIWLNVLHFARFVATLEPPPSAVRHLTPSVWAAFRLSRAATTTGTSQLRKMSTFLRDHPALPKETRQLLLTQRIPGAVVRESAYSDAEFDALKKAAARRFRTALQRIRQGREHLEQWRAGRFAPGTREHAEGRCTDGLCRVAAPAVPSLPAGTPTPSMDTVSRTAPVAGPVRNSPTWRAGPASRSARRRRR